MQPRKRAHDGVAPIAAAELVLVFSSRSPTQPLWHRLPNPDLWKAVAISLALLAAVV